jgi:chromosome segregation ATPase
LTASESADRFIAICGSEEALSEVDLEDMTIVQMPAFKVLADGESLHRERERRAQRRIESLELELDKLRRRSAPSEVDTLTRQLEERDSWIRDLEARAANAEARVDDLEAALAEAEGSTAETLEVTALREELDSMRRTAARSQKETRWAEERVRKVERELEAALAEIEATDGGPALQAMEALEQRVKQAEAESKKLRQELATQKASTASLEAELEKSEQEIEETQSELLASSALVRDLKRALGRANEEAKATAARAAQASAQTKAASTDGLATDGLGRAELDRIEAQLRERAGRIQELEEQLRKLEIFSKSLVLELSSSQGKTQLEQLQGQLDQLAQSLAEREADLVAAEWTIGELKQRLAARPS